MPLMKNRTVFASKIFAVLLLLASASLSYAVASDDPCKGPLGDSKPTISMKTILELGGRAEPLSALKAGLSPAIAQLNHAAAGKLMAFILSDQHAAQFVAGSILTAAGVQPELHGALAQSALEALRARETNGTLSDNFKVADIEKVATHAQGNAELGRLYGAQSDIFQNVLSGLGDGVYNSWSFNPFVLSMAVGEALNDAALAEGATELFFQHAGKVIEQNPAVGSTVGILPGHIKLRVSIPSVRALAVKYAEPPKAERAKVEELYAENGNFKDLMRASNRDSFVVIFAAQRCPACAGIKQALPEALESLSNPEAVSVIHVLIDKNNLESAQSLGVAGTPTFLIVKKTSDGKFSIPGRKVGLVGATESLEMFLKKHLK